LSELRTHLSSARRVLPAGDAAAVTMEPVTALRVVSPLVEPAVMFWMAAISSPFPS